MRRRCLIERVVLFLAIIATAVPCHQVFAADTPAGEQAAADTSAKPLSKSEARRRALAEEKELLRLFADTLEQVKSKYVDAKVSDRELIEAAIQGMISKLDPYSNYIPPEDFEQFRRGVDANTQGSAFTLANSMGSCRS